MLQHSGVNTFNYCHFLIGEQMRDAWRLFTGLSDYLSSGELQMVFYSRWHEDTITCKRPLTVVFVFPLLLPVTAKSQINNM